MYYNVGDEPTRSMEGWGIDAASSDLVRTRERLGDAEGEGERWRAAHVSKRR